jgi:hypothetical protein
MLHADNEEFVFKRVVFVLFFGKVLVVGARFSGESKLPPKCATQKRGTLVLNCPVFPE